VNVRTEGTMDTNSRVELKLSRSLRRFTHGARIHGASLLLLLTCASLAGSSVINGEHAQLTEARYAAIFTEREELLMTAAVAFAYVNLSHTPKQGYDIAAVIAWSVDDVEKTPEFVFGHNKNFEYRGEINHAEINTMRAAYELKRDPSVDPNDPEKVFGSYTYALANTTLYTTLEPCPMCASTMLLARVPRAVYFMEDPGIRDPKSHEVIIPIPKSVYGRTLKQERSTMKEAEEANRRMWRDATGPPYDKYFGGPSGSRYFNITAYLTFHGKELFETGYKKLRDFKIQNAENRDLYTRLKEKVGVP
jgi:tRNA(Arg) A34 adenosine deaminase TadA